MNRLYIKLLVFGLLALASCSHSKFVVPLNRGEQAVSVGLGGPVINVPGIATMPIPMTSVTYGKGITEDITVFGSWFPTASVFGTWQFDAGATVRLLENEDKKKGVTLTPGFNFAIDRFEWNSKFWPQLDANAYWKYNKKDLVQDDLLTGKRSQANILYAGLGSWYELSGKKAHGEPQTNRVLPIVQVGHDLNWGKWTFKSELKLIAPFASNQDIVVDYRSLLGDYGATGFYVGLVRSF